MTGLFGFVADGAADASVATSMACALQAHPAEAWAIHTLDGLSIGVLDGVDGARVAEWAAPAWSADRQHALWLAGEIFDAEGLDLVAPHLAATAPARETLLAGLVVRGAASLRDVDGEYQMAWWDRRAKTLRLFNDRFGGLPLYWSSNARGFAFACGVRGVLMAPGVSPAPDEQAIREAVTFGGFRLGGRTNVASVRMAPGGAAITASDGAVREERYWTWMDVEPSGPPTVDEAIPRLHDRWTTAVARRLRGASRPGQTLSGGLDSRAILAEASPRVPRWTAITYGVPGCDDARIARRVTEAVPADWEFLPLYDGDWLETRTGYVQQTDGLIQLGDLAHLELLPRQVARMDVHLSGYIGDAVAGPTFNDVRSIEDAAVAMPYYETALGLGFAGALDRLAQATSDAAWLSSRFLLFEHKLPQSTNRWSAAWRPWLRVRKPFTDYQFFDFCQGCAPHLRGQGRMYERWLRDRYPVAFARIPNHKTDVPAGADDWQRHAARLRRAGARLARRVAGAARLPVRPWSRAYVNDEVEWARPAVRSRIEAAILRSGSLSVDLWGREAVRSVLDDYFTRGAGPTQVVGALYVFETYHRDLAGRLRDAARRAAGVDCGRRL